VTPGGGPPRNVERSRPAVGEHVRWA
jgi:hypothetical protein